MKVLPTKVAECPYWFYNYTDPGLHLMPNLFDPSIQNQLTNRPRLPTSRASRAGTRRSQQSLNQLLQLLVMKVILTVMTVRTRKGGMLKKPLAPLRTSLVWFSNDKHFNWSFTVTVYALGRSALRSDRSTSTSRSLVIPFCPESPNAAISSVISRLSSQKSKIPMRAKGLRGQPFPDACTNIAWS